MMPFFYIYTTRLHLPAVARQDSMMPTNLKLASVFAIFEKERLAWTGKLAPSEKNNKLLEHIVTFMFIFDNPYKR